MRLRLALAGIVLAGVAVAVAAAVAVVGPGDGGSTGASDDTATIGRAPTTLPRPTTTVAGPTTTTTAVPRAAAEAIGNQAPAVEPAPGLVITNSGSAAGTTTISAVVGGSPGTIVTGGVIAVANSSSVRTP